MAAPLAVAFAHDDELPSGRHVIEASAGTGKTYALVGLAVRYLAEGRCTAAQLLVVTFSRSATRELRARLLERLTSSTALLGLAARGHQLPDLTDDPVAERLLQGTPEDIAARAGRLAQALADIDHATITTIHGLCDELLRRLGDERLGQLVSDVDDLARQILGDVCIRIARGHPHLGDDLPYPDQALGIIRAGMHTPSDALVPDASMDYPAGVRVWMAIAAGGEAVKRKAMGRLHTYDDLLILLRDRLTAEGGVGTGAAAELRDRLVVGLVDEFQDTDPVQWAVLQALFDDPSGADGRALVLVGDPKQAIYAFRGADIGTYLAARGDRPHRTLVENHRSDAPIVRACTHLFSGQSLGSGIEVTEVTPRRPVRLDPPPPAPILLRILTDDAPVARGKQGPRVGSMRSLVARDVAAHVVQLLSAPCRVTVPGPRDNAEATDRALRPDDIAVLVRTNAQAALVQRQLVRRGVPTVLNGVGNVLSTPAARDWLSLLRALLQPADGSRAKLAALTDLLGWSMASVLAAREDQLDDLHVLLHELADVASTRGIAALLRRVDAETDLAARLQGARGGSRRLTDLTHIGEVIHAEARRSGMGVAGLIGWLESAVAEAVEPPPTHLARRLEQAGGAVEIMTIHGAKGLERGIVLLPYLWDVGGAVDDVLTFTDPVTGARRVDVGGRFLKGAPPGAERERAHRCDLATQQQEEEEMRLAYVAATRARHHLVLWWGSGPGADRSPLSALLGRRDLTCTPAEAAANAAALEASHPDLFGVQLLSDEPSDDALVTTLGQPEPLRLGRLGRTIDHDWRRHSYSALIARGDADRLSSDSGPPEAPIDEDPQGGGQPAAHRALADPDAGWLQDPARAAEVPLSAMPGGAEVGTVIHAVLEHVDFAASDLRDQLARQLAEQSLGSSADLSDPALPDALMQVIHTSLGPATGERSLAQISRSDRIDELAFELPALTGPSADQPGRLQIADIADLLDAHLPEDDPMHGYGRILREHHGHIDVRGYLAGFIDLLVRIPGGDGEPDRFLIADYKTNRLGASPAEVLRIGHHDQAAMVEAMWHHSYPLQALFYLLATHRYLRWRLPDYDPEQHLIGAAYLFVRGMVGPQAPRQADGTPYGVLLWRPPTALLLATDALLALGPDRSSDGGARGSR